MPRLLLLARFRRAQPSPSRTGVRCPFAHSIPQSKGLGDGWRKRLASVALAKSAPCLRSPRPLPHRAVIPWRSHPATVPETTAQNDPQVIASQRPTLCRHEVEERSTASPCPVRTTSARPTTLARLDLPHTVIKHHRDRRREIQAARLWIEHRNGNRRFGVRVE